MIMFKSRSCSSTAVLVCQIVLVGAVFCRVCECVSQQGRNPEEQGSYLEGDIIIPSRLGATFRTVVSDPQRKWPRGIVPYVIDPSASFSDSDKTLIQRAISDFNRTSCVRWIPRTFNQDDYVFITRKDGCFSLVGRQGGAQDLSLSSNCMIYGTVVHEMLHSLGFWHEHSRFDRDHYVDINWQYLREGKRVNFRKHYLNEMLNLGPYDYGSIMHYSRTAFANDGLDSIVPKINTDPILVGQRVQMSEVDLWKLNKFYNCPGTSENPPRTLAPADPSTKVLPLPVQCDFESSLCDFYQQYETDEIDWERNFGKTESSLTGPEGDNTYGSGIYIYVESSNPVQPGYKADLWSPLFSSRGLFCIYGFAHMYGSQMGRLEIYQAPDSSERSLRPGEKLLLTLSGNQGDMWKSFTVQGNYSGVVQVRFRGIVGTGYHSDMALDDLTIEDGNCKGNAPTGRLLPFTCDFDKNMCGFRQHSPESAQLYWKPNSGPTVTSDTGPDNVGDHSVNGTGGYVYVESSGPPRPYFGQTRVALLEAPKVSWSGALCLDFWYHMYGETIGTLRVTLRMSYSVRPILWEKESDQGDIWRNAQVSINDFKNSYFIGFEAAIDSGYQSDIAIDDVKITKGLCQGTTAAAPTTTTKAKLPGTQKNPTKPADLKGDQVTIIIVGAVLVVGITAVILFASLS